MKQNAYESKDYTIRFESTHYGPDGEFIVTKLETGLYLSMDTTTLADIAKFQKEAKRIFNRAVKCTKTGIRYHIDLFVSTYKKVYSADGEFLRSEQLSFDAWEAADQDQDFQDGVQLYFRPDPKYTDPNCDMMIKDFFEVTF